MGSGDAFGSVVGSPNIACDLASNHQGVQTGTPFLPVTKLENALIMVQEGGNVLLMSDGTVGPIEIVKQVTLKAYDEPITLD